MTDKLKQSLERLSKQLDQIKKVNPTKALLAGAYTLQKYSQQNAPVDTGNLRSSAESEIVDDHAEMSFNTDYAYYQEVGTEKMEGRHYIQKAIDEHEADVVKAVGKQIIKDVVESAK